MCRRDMMWQTVPDSRGGNWESSVAVCQRLRLAHLKWTRCHPLDYNSSYYIAHLLLSFHINWYSIAVVCVILDVIVSNVGRV